MNEAQRLEIERIAAQIREAARRRAAARGTPARDDPGSPDHDGSPFDDGQAAADFASLHSGYDIRQAPLASRHRLLGPVVVAARKALRRLLAPLLDRQVAHNVAATRVATHLKEWMGVIRADLRRDMLAAEARLRDALALQAREVLAAQTELRASQAQAAHAQRQAAATTAERMATAERKLRRLLHALEPDRRPEQRPERPDAGGPGGQPSGGTQTDFDYPGFEERFRGSEEEIKERQRLYVRHFEGLEPVIDLGCGRGEFLELLRERGIKARGVDLDLDMILLCQDKGLDVAMDDALTYLGALPEASVGGIFAAQVIEHLSARRVLDLVQLCHRTLAPGGRLVLETPNPTCLMIFADTFYKDPSHVQPAHPETMRFLLEATGFQDIELEFLDPVDPSLRIPPLEAAGGNLEAFNQGIERVNSLLFGFRDYALIARKGVAADLPLPRAGAAEPRGGTPP